MKKDILEPEGNDNETRSNFDTRVFKEMMKNKLLILLIASFISSRGFAQATIIDSIIHQQYQRKFTVHTPTGYSNSKPVPLVVMLHGGGGTMANAQGFTNLNAVSNANGFLAVYPQGYGLIPSGGFSWADGRGTSADISGIDDLGFIDRLLDSLIARYTVDTNRVYLCGFSNGGFMTQRFACQQNRRFAAMASLGSIMDTALYARCKPSRPIPMLVMLGTEDPFVPYNGGPMIGSGNVTPVIGVDTLINFWRTNNSCLTANLPVSLPDIVLTDSSTVTLYQFTNCSCNSDLLFYRINDGGHTWPGVEIPSYELIAGQTNEDIQASAELWKFFKAHTRCNPSVGINEQSARPSITIHPNPATTELYLSISHAERTEISIRNILGECVIKTQNQNPIDISGLPSGVYVLTIIEGRNKHNQKFIKE